MKSTDTAAPTLAYVGIGSNLDDPLRQARLAAQHLRELPCCRFKALSSWYLNDAVDTRAAQRALDQPRYVNGVALLKTTLSPMALLRALQDIERRQGRRRPRALAARTLDLDLLLFGELHVKLPELSIPHPGIAQRDFVLQPLLEISPHLELPNGRAVDALLREMPERAFERISSADAA